MDWIAPDIKPCSLDIMCFILWYEAGSQNMYTAHIFRGFLIKAVIRNVEN